MTLRFAQNPAPHAPPIVGVPAVMRRVLYALVPAALCYTWFFGYGLLINFALAASRLPADRSHGAALARPRRAARAE